MSFQNAKIIDYDCDSSGYHGDQAVKRGDKAYPMSPSAIRAFTGCPSRWLDGYQLPETKAKNNGNLIDCRFLTPKLFQKKFVIQPAKYPSKGMECPQCKSITESQKCKACKCDRVEVEIENEWSNLSNTCKEWMATQKKHGKIVITENDLQASGVAIDRLMRDERIMAFHEASDRQALLQGEWKDKATGLVIPVRCLIDYAPTILSKFLDCLGDLKTTKSASRFAWRRYAFNMGYDVQAAFDIDLYNAATGENRNTWCFVIQENYPPYQTARRMFRDGFMRLGRLKYQIALARYANCLATGIWPDYDSDGPDSGDGWTEEVPEPWMENEVMNHIPDIEEPADEPPRDMDDVVP